VGTLSRESRIAGTGVSSYTSCESLKEAFCRSESTEKSSSDFSATLQRIALPKYFEVSLNS
jgi:hypothetical protein